MSNKRLRKLSGAVFSGLLIGGGMAGFGASRADASLTLSLQLPNGGTAYTLTSADVGKVVTMQVWATVTGSPTAGGDYGFGYAFFNVQSTVTNGGVATGSLLGRTLPTQIFDNGGLRGTNQDLNGDGIGDIGSTAPSPNLLVTGTNEFAKPNAYKYTDEGTGDQSNAPVQWDIQNNGVAVTNGYSWKVFTTTFKVNSLLSSVQNGASLAFNVVAPPISNGSPPAAQWYENGTDLAFPAGSTTNGAMTSAATGAQFLMGSGVTFTSNVSPVAGSRVSLGTGSGSGPTIAVSGSAGNYLSFLDIADSNSGSVTITSSPGNMSEGNTNVAVWLTGTGISALLSELQQSGITVLQAGNPLFDQIANGMFPGSSPTAVFQFAPQATPGHFDWNFAGADAGVLVDKLAVVPEPASLSLLGLGAVSMLARRRRRA